MTTITVPTTREAALEQLKSQAPLAPDRHEHSFDDDIDLQWQLPDRVVQLEIHPGLMTGQWLSWLKAQPREPLTRLRPIDLNNQATWEPLFQALQC